MTGKFTKPAPVALFAYNRPDHLRRTVEALAKNDLASETRLIVFSDGNRSEADARAVAEVRKYLAGASSFESVTVHERPRNFGLADSIVDGVTSTMELYERVIVLEDDILTSPVFLSYMNDALERYANEQKVMHITGYMFDIDWKGLPETFFMRQSSCLGWATWKRAWKHFHRNGADYINRFTPVDIHRFNLDGAYDYWSQLLANYQGTMKTWAVFWYACVFSKGGLCLHPRTSLVEHIGNDGSGTNCGSSQVSHRTTPASVGPIRFFPELIEEHPEAISRVQQSLSHLFGKDSHRRNSLRRLVKRISGLVLHR
ncbi:MAG TPA: glycosyltransferase [Syntrophobacteraceae bacterium]|nr:glycosyltransferase [Syntrophobacteraceae bacterium]